MSSLIKLKRGTPIAIERQIKPLFGLHKSVNDAITDLYNLFESPDLNLNDFENRNLFPAMDIVETDDYYNVELEMPGMSEEDIKIDINDDRLTVTGEKSLSKKHKNKNYLSREISFGHYERSVIIPPTADASKASANFKKGMLWIKIPKKKSSKGQTRAVKVEKAK